MRWRVWALAWPVILSNLSVPLLGAVDTAMMGREAAPSALGAVAIGALIFDFVYWGFGFLRMGTTGTVATARGAGDTGEVRAALGRALGVGLVLGLVLLAGQGLIEGIAFRMVEGSEQVITGAHTYFQARIWAAPAVLMNYAVLGWLIGTQRPGAVLLLQLVTNGVNVALDLYLVGELGMAEGGVAVATAIAQYTSLLVALPILHRALAAEGGRWSRAQLLDTHKLRAMWSANFDIFVRTLCLIGAFAYFTTRGALQGEVVLAANAVLMNLQTLMAYGLDGFAHAAEALVGEAVGARSRGRLMASLRAVSLFGGVLALLCAAVYALFGPEIVGLLTHQPAVIAEALRYLPWAVGSPLVSVWCFLLDGIFIGAGRTGAMRNAMIVSLGLFVASVWLSTPTYGNHGLWFSLMLFMVARSVTLGAALPRLLRLVGR